MKIFEKVTEKTRQTQPYTVKLNCCRCTHEEDLKYLFAARRVSRSVCSPSFSSPHTSRHSRHGSINSVGTDFMYLDVCNCVILFQFASHFHVTVLQLDRRANHRAGSNERYTTALNDWFQNQVVVQS